MTSEKLKEYTFAFSVVYLLILFPIITICTAISLNVLTMGKISSLVMWFSGVLGVVHLVFIYLFVKNYSREYRLKHKSL